MNDGVRIKFSLVGLTDDSESCRGWLSIVKNRVVVVRQCDRLCTVVASSTIRVVGEYFVLCTVCISKNSLAQDATMIDIGDECANRLC